MTKNNITQLIVFIITFFVFCSPAPLFAQPDTTFDIHAAFALTGIGATFGSQERNGAELAIEEFNSSSNIEGKKVKLIVEDTQSNNTHTLTAIRKLLSAYQANVILGPTWLDSYQSVLPIVDKEKIFVLTPSAAIAVFKKSESQNPYIFSTWYDIEIEIKMLLKHIKEDGKSKITLMFDQDPFFQTVSNLIKQWINQLGLEIVSEYNFDLGTADFRSTLSKIKNSRTEGLVIGFGDEGNLLNFFKQRSELVPNIKLYGTDYLDGYTSQKQWVVYMNNLDYISTHIYDLSFVEKYQKRFNTAPVLSASNSYDATSILLQALNAGCRDSEAIRNFLLSSEFNTVTFGKMKFGKNGGVLSSEFKIKKVRDNLIVEN